VVTQAQITLHSLDSNTDVAIVSDAAGNYLFTNVKAGNYRLTGVKEGFANAVVDNVNLAARQEIRLDLRFALATANQQVMVTENAVVVNTENATLSDSKVSLPATISNT
jgi:hypothetical protein